MPHSSLVYQQEAMASLKMEPRGNIQTEPNCLPALAIFERGDVAVMHDLDNFGRREEEFITLIAGLSQKVLCIEQDT